MFSGIVDHCGEILEIQTLQHALRLWIKCQFSHLNLGESIAVDGICLTISAVENGQFACELSPETLRLTTAQRYLLGSKVNLERSLKFDDRLGGHWVTGHIDQTIRISSIKTHQDFTHHAFKEINFSGLSQSALPLLVTKGSVAINGVSLTVNQLLKDGFSVMLIPHTLERTNLSMLKEGDTVNVEFDQLAKLIARQVQLHLQGECVK